MELFSAAKYLLRGFYGSSRINVFLPLFICVSATLVSLLAMYLPKIVLDAVERGVTVRELFGKVFIIGALFAAMSIAAMLLRNELELISQNFLYTELTARWERGMLRMEYGDFVQWRSGLAILHGECGGGRRERISDCIPLMCCCEILQNRP